METEKLMFVLNENQESKIELFCSVASSNNCVLTVKELTSLASLDVAETDFVDVFARSTNLHSKYQIESGLIIERALAHTLPDAGKRNQERFLRAVSNINFAKDLAMHFKTDTNLKVLSVSGSTSYLSASEEDDLDLFCVATKDSVWIFLTKAFILARWTRFRNKRHPQLCFSYILDEAKAEKEFSSPHGGLFARDALTTKVILGGQFYADLLEKGSWMAGLFPNLYAGAIEAARSNAVPDLPVREPSTRFKSALNALLYRTVGTYIKVKSHFLNKRLSKKGDPGYLFKPRIGRDHCIFESMRYLELNDAYACMSKRQLVDGYATYNPRDI